MAYVESSASFVCAVLEQAGYQAQSLYLDSFQSFFRNAGALIYCLAGAGAVFSIAIHGSYRAARYLLVGPALFWFLVGPRITYDGMMWRVGGGSPRGLQDRRGAGVAQADVREALLRAGIPGQEMKVAEGFALFTRLTNELVHGLVDVMLKDEDGEYLMHISRTRGLDYIMAAVPYDPTLIDMLEGNLITGCPELLNYGLALSARDVQPEVIRALGPAAANATRRRAYYTEHFDLYADSAYTEPNETTKRVLRTYASKIGVEANASRLSCRQMWQLTAVYLRDHAAGVTTKVLQLARGDGTNEASACAFLMDKLGTGATLTEGQCREQLHNAITCYMLKNAMLDRRSMSRWIQRFMNGTETQGAFPEGMLIPLAELPNGLRWGEQAGASSSRLLGGRNMVSHALEFFGFRGTLPTTQQGAPFEVYAPGNAARDRNGPAGGTFAAWTPAARLLAIGSSYDASMVELPKYTLKEMRQRLFSWALNVPYWQGVILYFLAVIYPFFSLIVLVPGKGQAFFNLPLAWLWAKSWDIGLAAVMVFDRVLWNIFPHARLSTDVRQTPLNQLQFFQAITETMKGDQAWNLNLHYMLLSIATLSIPAITGTAILKSRRAMLSSFTEKLISDVRSAGSMLGGAYGTQVMQDRVKAMREIGALGAMSMGAGGQRPANSKLDGPDAKGDRGGFGANGRHEAGVLFGTLNAIGNGFKAGQILPKQDMASWGKDQVRNVAAFTRGYAAVTESTFKHDRAHRMAFDPVVGRWGELRMRMQAWAASQDKSGGFEIDDPAVGAHDEFIDMFATKFGLLLGAASKMAAGGGAFTPIIADSKTLQDSVKRALDMLGSQAFKEEKDPAKMEANRLALFEPLVTPLQRAGLVGDAKQLSGFLTDAFHLSPKVFRQAVRPPPYNGEGERVFENGKLVSGPYVNDKTWSPSKGKPGDANFEPGGYGKWIPAVGDPGAPGHVPGHYEPQALTDFQMRTQFWSIEDLRGGPEHFRFPFKARAAHPQMFWNIQTKSSDSLNTLEMRAVTPFFDVDQMVPSTYGHYYSQAWNAAEPRLRSGSVQAWSSGVVAPADLIIKALRANPDWTVEYAQTALAGLYKDYQDGARKFWQSQGSMDAATASAQAFTFKELYTAARRTGPAPIDEAVRKAAGNEEVYQNEVVNFIVGKPGNWFWWGIPGEGAKHVQSLWELPLTRVERATVISQTNEKFATWFRSGVAQQRIERQRLEKMLIPLHIGPDGFKGFFGQ